MVTAAGGPAVVLLKGHDDSLRLFVRLVITVGQRLRTSARHARGARGLQEARAGKYDEAIATCDQAISEDPKTRPRSTAAAWPINIAISEGDLNKAVDRLHGSDPPGSPQGRRLSQPFGRVPRHGRHGTLGGRSIGRPRARHRIEGGYRSSPPRKSQSFRFPSRLRPLRNPNRTSWTDSVRAAPKKLPRRTAILCFLAGDRWTPPGNRNRACPTSCPQRD